MGGGLEKVRPNVKNDAKKTATAVEIAVYITAQGDYQGK